MSIYGRRGWGLFAFGLGAVARGALYLPWAVPASLPDGLQELSVVVPMTVWAVVWIVVGLACVVGSTRWGWCRVAAYALPALGAIMLIWAAGYLLGFARDPFTMTADPVTLLPVLALNRELLTVFTYGSPGFALLLWAPFLVVRGERAARAQ